MAEMESIIQQASLFLSDVGIETHPFKVDKLHDKLMNFIGCIQV